MNPGELKKLRNKQRKAKRKAELEKQQVAQAQEKREHHNKSRQQTEAELDAPQQDELVPDKLERVSNNLKKKIILKIIKKNIFFSLMSHWSKRRGSWLRCSIWTPPTLKHIWWLLKSPYAKVR